MLSLEYAGIMHHQFVTPLYFLLPQTAVDVQFIGCRITKSWNRGWCAEVLRAASHNSRGSKLGQIITRQLTVLSLPTITIGLGLNGVSVAFV
jgi:hypothetical protein